ncbi:MAG: outer membrane lipid asymmetry maintenance protein MlaD [Sphingomonadaceae bacterium]
MRSPFREHLVEALTGLLVVVLAISFAWFAWMRTGGGVAAGAIKVVALFPNMTGVEVGTDVRVAGLKVGTITEQALDPATFQVKATLALDPEVKIPVDSSAAITSEGLLGGSYVALIPGGDTVPLKSGDVITDTQGAMDMMGLVGQFINRSGSDSEDAEPVNTSAP